MTAPDQPTEAPDAVLPDFLTPERRAETRAFMARNPDVTFRYSADAMRMLLDSLDALTARCEQAERERDKFRRWNEEGHRLNAVVMRGNSEYSQYLRHAESEAEDAVDERDEARAVLAAAEDERRAAQEREATAYRRRAGTIERLRTVRAERDEIETENAELRAAFTAERTLIDHDDLIVPICLCCDAIAEYVEEIEHKPDCILARPSPERGRQIIAERDEARAALQEAESRETELREAFEDLKSSDCLPTCSSTIGAPCDCWTDQIDIILAAPRPRGPGGYGR